MIKKLVIKEDNGQLKDRYTEFIINNMEQPIEKVESDLYFKNSDYKKVKEFVSDLKRILSDANFELTFVDYDNEYSLSTYKYTKSEFGLVVTITIMLDDSIVEEPNCKISIDVEKALGENSINEDYDPNWVEDASDADLLQLRSVLEELDMNAERIYKAVKNSSDRNNESELNGLISAMKNINVELEDYAEAWEIN